MAQIIAVNIYEINGVPVSTIRTEGFPTAMTHLSPYTGTNTSLYGDMTVGEKRYSVVETVAALKTLANA